jgi:hypothetical protein
MDVRVNLDPTQADRVRRYQAATGVALPSHVVMWALDVALPESVVAAAEKLRECK